jgi:Ca2+-binding EF-hand superfamily protein
MTQEIPYYTLDEDGNSEFISSNGEAYIDDGDLKELLLELLGDNSSDEDIQEILEAASDENLTEEEFDKLIDEFILKNKN